MRRLVVAAAAAAAPACLSTPPPAAIDGGVDAPDAGPGACTRDPRPTAACNARDDFTSLPWTPAPGFRLRGARVDDVNADGAADLLIIDNDPAGERIHVLLGPLDGDPRVHATVATGFEVGDLEVRQLVDDGSCPELTVFGRNAAETAGVLQVWRYDGTGGVMFDPTPVVGRTLVFTPVVTGVPTLARWADLRGEGLDLLVADLTTLQVLAVGGDLDALATADPETVYHLHPQPNWDSINGVDPFPVADCARDGVLVSENREAHLLEETSPGGPLGGGATQTLADVLNLGSARADVDGVPPDDVVVAGYDRIGAWLLAEDDAGGVTVTPAHGGTGYLPNGPSSRIDGFAVGDLGGTAAPDLVIIDFDDPLPLAVLVDGLTVTSGTTLTSSVDHIHTDLPSGFEPGAVVIADLHTGVPGAEAWIVGVDGRIECLRRAAALPELEPCPG